MRINVIGSIEVVDDDGAHVRLSAGNKELLALLVAAGPAGLSVDRLADETWGEDLPASWESATRMAVTRLRKKLGDDVVPRGEYRLVLDSDAVDAWAVLDGSAPDGGRHDPLTTVDVLPGLDTTSSLISSFTLEVHDAQLRAALSMLDASPDAADLRRLLRFVASRGVDDAAASRILRASSTAGLAAQVAETLDEYAAQMADIGLPVGPDVAAFAAELLGNGAVPGGAAAAVPSVVAAPAIASNAPAVETELVGRAADFVAGLDLATTASTVLVVGEAGSGKSTVLTAVARDAVEAGLVVRHTRARRNADMSFGAFFELIPTFTQWFTDVGAVLPSGDRAALAWAHIDRLVTDAAPGGRLVLVVDDAQWLDSPSAALLPLLAGSERVRLVVGTRPGARENELRSLLAGTAVSDFEVPRLSLDEIVELVRTRRDLPSVARRRVAEQLLTASGGVGIAVSVLLDAYDTTSGSFGDTGDAPYPKGLDDLVAECDPEHRRVGVAAAVLGSPFSVTHLAELLDTSDVDVLDALDRLIDQNLVIETTDPERFEMRHMLVHDAFLRASSTATAHRLHRSAAALSASPHDLAHHLRSAGELVPLAERVAANLESATIHAAGGRHDEALADFRWVAGADPDAMTPAHQTAYCRALELTGQTAAARRVREQAMTAALDADDVPTAAELAGSGLPEAEMVDGDLARIEALERIDMDRLDPDRRLEHGLLLARQLGFVGRSADAAAVLDSLDDATRPADQLRLGIARRTSASATWSPWERMGLLPDELLRGVDDGGLLSQTFLLQSLDRLEAGDTTAARELLDRSTEADGALASPIRNWHRQLLGATLTELAGDVAAANDLRAAAADGGYRLGITAALESMAAAQFTQDLALGRAAGYTDLFASGTGAETSPVLFEAGHAAALFAAGRRFEALERAGGVIERFDAAPVMQGLAAVAICADVIGPDHDATDHVDALLAARGHSILVVGAGAFCLGPVARWRAALAEGERRVELLNEAIDLAETAGATLWQANALTLRAESTGSTDDVDTAHRLLAEIGVELQG